MAKIDTAKIEKIFDYVSNSTFPLTYSDGTIVFGRADPLVAKKAAEIYHKKLTGYLLFTGGIGKDSSKLTEPESYFLARLAINDTEAPVPESAIYLEPNSTNGAENCRFSLNEISEKSLPHNSLILLAHPTSLRRLASCMKNLIAREKPMFSNTVFQRIGTDYHFDSSNPKDQKEAVEELLRLADWPAKGWSVEQKDLPQDLVAYAREIREAI